MGPRKLDAGQRQSLIPNTVMIESRCLTEPRMLAGDTVSDRRGISARWHPMAKHISALHSRMKERVHL